MRAKDYMLQYKRLNTLLENKNEELEQKKSLAYKITPSLSGDSGSGTPDPHKREAAWAAMADLRAEIVADMLAISEKQREIIKLIEHLPVNEYDVLHKHYIQGLDYQAIADLNTRSYRWVIRAHDAALKSLQELLDKEVK